MSDSFVLAFVPGVTPAKWVGVWKQRMPRTAIELHPLPQAAALQELRSGDASMALLREPFDSEGLRTIALYEELAVVVAPREHPIAAFDDVVLADLDGENRVDGDARDDAANDAVELVAANIGVAVMPQSIARLYSRRDVVSRPVRDAPTTRIVLAWPERAASVHIEEFIGIVRGRTANSSRGQAPEPGATKKSTNRAPNRRQR